MGDSPNRRGEYDEDGMGGG
jgi:hypothetical protein